MAERIERGEYRVTPISAADDPDVHAMSAGAFKLLTMLRLTLPVTGLGVVYPSAMCDRVGCDRVELEKLYVELERPTALRPQGWVRREANVVWLIDGLDDEPSLTPNNAKKHVPYVRKLILNVDQRLAIVAAFRDRYHVWFANPIDTDSIGIGKGIDRLSGKGKVIPIGKGIDTKSSSSSSSSSKNSGESLSRNERPARSTPPRPNDDSPLRSLAREAQELDAMPIADFAVAFYGDSELDRQRDVVQQLRRLIAGERVLSPFGHVSAYGVRRLAKKCRAVSDERRRVRSNDSAIVVLFAKLADTSDVSDEYRAQLAAEERAIHAERQDTTRLVTEWQAANPDQAAAIRTELAAALPEIPPEPAAPLFRRATPAERDAHERWTMETAATRFVLDLGVTSRIMAIIAGGESQAGVA